MPVFLDGGGECGALIKARDWSGTLGPVESWSQSLKAATGLILRSPVAMVMLWGEDGIMLYNDAYSKFAGARHPELLGSKVREGWPEVADFNDNVMKVGLSGGTLSYKDQELTLYRNGEPEQVWMDLDYSPVIGDDGHPAGVLSVVIETTDRVLSARSLRETSRRLDAILNNTRMAIFLMDERQQCIFANAGAEQLTGYRFEDLRGRRLHDVIHHKYPDGRPYPFEECPIDRAFPEKARMRGEELFVAPNGSFYPVAFTASPMLDDNGTPIGTVIEAYNISEEKAREAALRESEERFRNMADNTPVMLWVTDETGYCTYLNKRWYEFTGQRGHQGEGFGWLEAVHPDDRPAAERAFLHANEAQSGYEVDFRVRRADGIYRWCIDAAKPRFDATGRYLGYVGSVIDIDERREAAEKLRLSEEMLRSVIEQMPVGVAIARSPSGDIFEYNQALEEMLGHPILSEDASTYNRYGGIDDEGNALPAEAYPLGRAVMFGETVVGNEMRYRRGDGLIIHLLGHASPVIGPSGKPDLAVVTLQDITDRKKAEQHQRLLIDELSHRAKNLLAIIQSVAQQSFKNGGSPAAMLASFEGRLGALAAAHGILTRQRWESAPLRQVICDTITAVKADDQRLRLDGPDLMVAPKTSVSIAMAIHELTTNAVKYGSFSNEEGSVLVTWRIEDGRLKLEWRERGGPPVEPPAKRGFGSRMIERGLAAELGGKVTIDFEPEGVVCRVDAPFAEAE